MTEVNKTVFNDSGKRILAAGARSPYDTEAINLIKDKQYLARILRDCTSEFRGMKIEDIILCIEDPSVGIVPVDPGLSNPVMKGMPTESKEIGEGVVTYDVRFFARNPRASMQDTHDRINIRLLVDVEIQKEVPSKYDLVTRGILYGGRMLSEQLGREVRNSNYDSLQKAYSIWICMNCPPESANTITRYSLKQDLLYGRIDGAGQARYDLLQVIIIRLPKEKKAQKAVNEPTELMKILSTLFSEEMSVKERMDRLSELGIIVTEEMRERMNVMCNLSEGIYESGRAAERAETERQRARADEQQARADEQQARADELQVLNEELKAQLEEMKEKLMKR